MVAFDPMLAVQGGGYINIFSVCLVMIVLLFWARMLTWADKDAPAAHLPRVPFNLFNLVGMIVGFTLFFILPWFILSFLALLVVLGIEVAVYLVVRKKHVGLGDLEKQWKAWLETWKKKPDVGAAEAGKVSITGKDNKPTPVPENDSPDRPAYDAVQGTLYDPLMKQAQEIQLGPDGEGMSVRYTVDNYPYKGVAFDKATGSAAISYMKWAAGLNVEDRRKPQTGALKVLVNKEKHELRLQTAGSTAGEQVKITIDPKLRHNYALKDLGLTPAQQTMLDAMIKDHTGLIILSAPKSHGLTSLFYTILKSHDLFLQHAQTVERDQEQDIEGITQTKLPASASGAEEFKAVDWAISQAPDILGVSKVEDSKTARALLEYAKSPGKRAYVCMRANSTFEALELWKRLVGDAHEATESLRLVINARVLRKLCMACKEGFTPDPAMLKKLNLAPDGAATLYKAREQVMRDAKGKPVLCEFCQELRFKGRIGVFETLQVDGDLRTTVEAGKPLNQSFRKQRGRYLQEEALSLVEQGETSVQEVLRVLKPAGEGGSSSSAAAPAGSGRPAPGAGAPVRNR